MNQFHSFEREFELRFLKSQGEAFQELFAEIMERRYPGDFQRVRPHGRSGDHKCDGYLASQRTVFQVYGPERLVLHRLLRKLHYDFAGAIQHWAARMERWVFVHNQRAGLPPQAVQVIDDLRNHPGAPLIAVWGYEELRREFHHLRPDAVQSLFPSLSDLADPHPGHRLPRPDAIEKYWTWVATELPDSGPAPHLDALQALNLPIRLATPQQAGHLHSAAAPVADRVTRETDSRPPTADDGSFAKGAVRAATDLAHVLRAHRHLLIVGDAGSGKSTLLCCFARRQAKYLLSRTLARAHRQTPVIVELWRFGPDRPLLDLLVGSVKRSGSSITRDEVLTAVDRGYVALLLDGLDEVSLEHRRECLAQIITFVEQYPQARTVLTSRPFPDPPHQFHRLEIAPLTDYDIATALRAQFDSGREFRMRFAINNPKDFVKHRLRPEVRGLCRQPLTLGLMLTLLVHEDRLPEALYGVYDRFLSLLLDWEVRKGYLPSAAAAAAALEEAAYFMAECDQVSVPAFSWVRAAGRAVVKSRALGVVTNVSAEDIFRILLSTGLLRDLGGVVSFSHQTFLEFLAARHILVAAKHADPVALRPGVARFLCGAMEDVTALLEAHLLGCSDVQELMPLLEEASRQGSNGGRFEALYRAIVFGQELGLDLTYSLRGPEVQQFTEHIDQFLETCIDFQPKALSVLKDAAFGVVTALQWEQSRSWFEGIVAGLETYGWPGAPLYRRLADIGVFECKDALVDDGTDSTAGERVEGLFAFLGALDKDRFDEATQLLVQLDTALVGAGELSYQGGINARQLPLFTCPL
jgi:hypothetical protein